MIIILVMMVVFYTAITIIFAMLLAKHSIRSGQFFEYLTVTWMWPRFIYMMLTDALAKKLTTHKRKRK